MHPRSLRRWQERYEREGYNGWPPRDRKAEQFVVLLRRPRCHRRSTWLPSRGASGRAGPLWVPLDPPRRRAAGASVDGEGMVFRG